MVMGKYNKDYTKIKGKKKRRVIQKITSKPKIRSADLWYVTHKQTYYVHTIIYT